jgi:hypothetical protein
MSKILLILLMQIINVEEVNLVGDPYRMYVVPVSFDPMQAFHNNYIGGVGDNFSSSSLSWPLNSLFI